ncbi:glycoside hydrolase family 43 protein [Phytoactinopolyspora mesophila]|uniref:Family 43 glycosylhydrolase n=1 Tax=Phytoactinopolyspora mesophila TaxID=2650750 RepID=A0A7K3M7Y8_9ACTN|nr:glycoside hydrolase family 43 protein [Phytoactinopolyspora mesophila]NDL59439.1 family 43 glycosylhydrolase [Phytoactinopolyspora mesophila]
MAQRPIIAGFHPDPSVCRVGGDYYLVTSSFEYFPGVPIFHSTDLRRWRQIGNVLDRAPQFQPGHPSSGGIFAPTLRAHDGRLWMVTTDVSGQGGQLIVTTDDPSGPWSDPVRVAAARGVDPDIAWDETGHAMMTWCSSAPELRGIVQAHVDPASGELLEEPRKIWSGTGLAFPEAPHLYRIGGWWYLMIAEGGTERGHCVSIARSRTSTGPFEPAPGNPILTHRSTADPVQNTGHADLVQGPDGEWAMVYLAVRPRGMTPMFHVNGRETFLAGVSWHDGWPQVDEHRYPVAEADHDIDDDLRAGPLHPRWISPDAEPGKLVSVDGDDVLLRGRDGPGLLATRVRDEHWTTRADIDPRDAVARLVLRIDDHHWYAVEADAAEVRATARIGPLESIVGQQVRAAPGPLTLVIRSVSATQQGPDDIELGVEERPGQITTLARLDGRYLSTEVAGGFTGRVIGVESRRGDSRLLRFRYTSAPGT